MHFQASGAKRAQPLIADRRKMFPTFEATTASEWGAKTVELQIHVHKPHIIVNMRGTRLTVTYELSSDGQSLVESPFWTGYDRNAPISSNEFRSSAWLAAEKKAHEIGWISAGAMSHESQNGAPGSAKLFSLVTRIDAGRAKANSAQASSSFEAMIECAAQALFEHVFAGSERLDVKHLWMNCDEATKEGFRGEARAALQAVCLLLRGDTLEQTAPRRLAKFARS
jgi:hypothetical protein